MTATPRPDKHAILGKLKGFQRRTVEHVVERLLDPAGSRRFLVADEVGLGKTLVARGVIAEVVDRLWDDVGRVDILYVCSNTALAMENLRKLQIGGERVEATRLTLIPKQHAEFDDKLNFISFTPGTALQVDGYGRADERVVLYALLRGRYGDETWLKNLLQGSVEPHNWRERHVAPEKLPTLDPKLAEKFHQNLRGSPSLVRALAWAGENLVHVDARLDDAQISKRYRTVGELRKLLARTCIDSLEPDLIILDEFQRFKELLPKGDEETELSELAGELFRYVTPEKNPVAILMLSATPYRYQTVDESVHDDHYKDFRETLRFLYRNDARFVELEKHLEAFRRALLDATDGARMGVREARDALQACLKQVMVRTERVDSTADRDAMVVEPAIRAPLAKRDLEQYVAADALAESLDTRDIVEFWKSAPYLFNFMKKPYRIKEDFEDQRHKVAVREAFAKAASELLTVEQIQAYGAVDPANARLRALAAESMGTEQWSMLWLPPTVPYWPLAGPWAKNPDFSKKLVFSAWNVVPDVVSAWLSYDAERGMVGAGPPSDYTRFYKRRRQALRYGLKNFRPATMTTLVLALPCLALADGVSPLAAAVAGRDVSEGARERVEALVETLRPLAGDEPAGDPRWHWAAPLLLDRDDPTLESLLTEWVSEPGEEDDEGEMPAEGEVRDPAAKGTALRRHLDEARKVLRGEIRLGSIPATLAEVLVELALGGPAVLAARALAAKGASDAARRRAGARIASGFRTLFNQPPVIRLLKAGSEADDDGYWRATLRYAIEGNLQAVLDEQVHLLWEQFAWDDRPADEICDRVVETLCDSVTTKVSRVSPDIYAAGERRIEEEAALDDAGAPERLALRTSFALRYGTVTGASGSTDAREESVRTAFKSPFFPFVLVSTSVGQEGLDFHPWCHDIWHWNLPGNPVDLEQREGRVHRYKGLAVRKNVAEGAMAILAKRWKPGTDPWDVLFGAAEERARAEGTTSELVPYWVAPGPHKVRRCVPLIPFSSEVAQLQRLKRSLAIYRAVFGQPRQEELLELLEGSEISREQLEEWTVSLRPD